jgi:hypothetical protein
MNILTETRSKGEIWHRIHRKEYGWKWFGPAAGQPPSNRFDAPDHEYGTCCFGRTEYGAYSETLLRSPGKRLLDRSDLDLLVMTRVELIRPVRLARAHGSGLARLGVSAVEMHGPHAVCRQLSLAIWSHESHFDGIAYRSRFDNDELCFALFDRAQGALKEVGTLGLTDNPARLAEILREYDVGLA